MNNSNDQDIEIEILNKQNIEHEVSNNQNLEPEVLNNQDVELKVLAAYDSTDDLSDIDTDNFDDIEEFSVGKVFKNWDQHVGHELNPLASQFDPILRKLPKEIVEEIRFLTTVAKADATMQNSLTEEKFNERREKLLQNYPQSRDYLMRSLGYCTKSWAHAFTSRYFTAGVQSTSHNEGENSTLKRLFGSSSLSLCELFEALEKRYQEEVDYCKFVS
ncbi:protein far1-related sequence 5-like [Gigaspora margarita]|uniref:Protein far1-related sequence 5-like n=1 Tax=Gigaspora margarita TaxID=4874 RepID=A0A8H4A7D1_GIGMA|nr:protein far1-related sequence 5-like [Gigaspora margarita]